MTCNDRKIYEVLQNHKTRNWWFYIVKWDGLAGALSRDFGEIKEQFYTSFP
jgi:hypothetical protein